MVYILYLVQYASFQQLIIRDVVKLEETERQIFTDLECVNSVNDIFDECISIGEITA